MRIIIMMFLGAVEGLVRLCFVGERGLFVCEGIELRMYS